jgi:tellurite resistance protein TerC
VKLVLHALHGNELPFLNGGEGVAWAPEIGTLPSLLVIVCAMAVAVVASLIKLRVDARRSGRTP